MPQMKPITWLILTLFSPIILLMTSFITSFSIPYHKKFNPYSNLLINKSLLIF